MALTDKQFDDLCWKATNSLDLEDLKQLTFNFFQTFPDDPEFLYEKLGFQICSRCDKPNESVVGEPECDCKCPACGTHVFNDTTIDDHGRCYDCQKKWQHGELKG